MLPTTASFSGYASPLATVRGIGLQTNSTSPFSLSLRASLQEYPLASRIVVKNLPYSTGETCLQKEFSSFGEIAEVKLAKDVTTKRSKGFAFIQYTCLDDAMLALETMDQKVFDGRMIHVELAKPGRDAFGGRPMTTGPPKKWHLPEQEEVVDCWAWS